MAAAVPAELAYSLCYSGVPLYHHSDEHIQPHHHAPPSQVLYIAMLKASPKHSQSCVNLVAVKASTVVVGVAAV